MKYKAYIDVKDTEGMEHRIPNPKMMYERCRYAVIFEMVYGIDAFNKKNGTDYTLKEFTKIYNLTLLKQLRDSYELSVKDGFMELFEAEE